jgi:hypothetical protein
VSALDARRSARRIHLARHLHRAGPRPTLEALIAVEQGQPLDDVLAEFGRVPVRAYHEVGASEFPALTVIDGGRDE